MIDSEVFVLKVIPDVDEASLNQTLAFFLFINKQDLKVPCPMEALNGQLYGKGTDHDNTVLYYLYAHLEGHNLEDSIQFAIETGLLEDLGKEIAKLHQVMNNYPMNRLNDVKKWDETEGLMIIYEAVHKDIPDEIVQLYNKSRRCLK